jgi:hypothetical protein
MSRPAPWHRPPWPFRCTNLHKRLTDQLVARARPGASMPKWTEFIFILNSALLSIAQKQGKAPFTVDG